MAAIAVYVKILELDSDDLRAHRRAHQAVPGPLALDRPARRSTRRRPISSRDPDEKKRIYYQVGAVYERELGDVAASIDTYQKSSSSIRTTCRRSRASTSSTSTRRTGTSSSRVLTRESRDDRRSERSDQLPVPDRRALREAPRRRRARDRALSRDPRSSSPTTSRRSTRSRVSRAASSDPLGAARGARARSTTRSSDWPSLISVHEVQVQHTDDPFQKVELLHRIARLYEDALDDHARGVRHVRARASRSTTATRTRSQNLERLAMVVNRWPDVAALYDAELDKLAEDSGALRRARAAHRADLRDAARGRRERHRALPPRARSRGREPGRDHVARSALHADRALGRPRRRSSRAKPRLAQSPDEILEFKYRLGQVHQARLDDLDAAIAAYREVLSAAPEHAQTLEALESALRRRA